MSKTFSVLQQNSVFSLSGKSKNQIPCFPSRGHPGMLSLWLQGCENHWTQMCDSQPVYSKGTHLKSRANSGGLGTGDHSTGSFREYLTHQKVIAIFLRPVAMTWIQYLIYHIFLHRLPDQLTVRSTQRFEKIISRTTNNWHLYQII